MTAFWTGPEMANLALGIAGMLVFAMPVVVMVWLMWLFAALDKDADTKAKRGFRRATTTLFGLVCVILSLVVFGATHVRVLHY